MLSNCCEDVKSRGLHSRLIVQMYLSILSSINSIIEEINEESVEFPSLKMGLNLFKNKKRNKN